jgi:hypothetical protein
LKTGHKKCPKKDRSNTGRSGIRWVTVLTLDNLLWFLTWVCYLFFWLLNNSPNSNIVNIWNQIPETFEIWKIWFWFSNCLVFRFPYKVCNQVDFLIQSWKFSETNLYERKLSLYIKWSRLVVRSAIFFPIFWSTFKNQTCLVFGCSLYSKSQKSDKEYRKYLKSVQLMPGNQVVIYHLNTGLVFKLSIKLDCFQYQC